MATAGIERMWQFGAQIGSLKPEALDRLDADGTMDAYADMTGVPASVLVDRRQADVVRPGARPGGAPAGGSASRASTW